MTCSSRHRNVEAQEAAMSNSVLLDRIREILGNSPNFVHREQAGGEAPTTPIEQVTPTPPARSEFSQDVGANSDPLTKPNIQEEILLKPKAGARARCRAWLEIRLRQGPVPLSVIHQEAKELGFSTKALRVSRRQLNVRPLPCLTLLPRRNENGNR